MTNSTRIITITVFPNEAAALMSALDVQIKQAYDFGTAAQEAGDITLAAHFAAAAKTIDALRTKVFASPESWSK